MTPIKRGLIKGKRSKAIILALIFSILLTPFVSIISNASWTSWAALKVYTVNIFGWETTNVITNATITVNSCNTKFDTFLSYTTHSAYAAWWCFTCYSQITSYTHTISPTLVEETDYWTQGSWNVQFTGSSTVSFKWEDPCYVRLKVYYNVDGTTITVVDNIRKALDWFAEFFQKIVGSS